MKTEELSSSLSPTEVLSSSSIIRTVKKEEKENELEDDDDNKINDDEENHQWIEIFENITNHTHIDNEDEGNEGNDDDDNGDHNEGVTTGRSTSSIVIKTEEEVPDNVPSKSSMIEMEREVNREVLISTINNPLVWDDGTITGWDTAFEDQQQVKKQGKKKDDEDEGNDDDNNNDDDPNEGVTGGRSSSSITIKKEGEEVPDSIPSKSSMIKMEEEEEVDEQVLTSIINDTLVWGDGTTTGRVTTGEAPHQVKKEGKKKGEELVVAAAEQGDDNDNDKGYESWAKGIFPNTNDGFPPAASTQHCVRRKVNSNNNKDYADVDDERNPPTKKKRRVMAAVEDDINCEVDEDHTNDGDGDIGGILSKTIPTEMKYNNVQIELWNKMFRRLVAYKEQHGNTNVSSTYKEDQLLGLWVWEQRKTYKKEMVSKYQVDRLNSISFVWCPFSARWMEMYHRLIVFKKQHKTTSVRECNKEDAKLRLWIKYQRALYRKKELSLERINYLEAMGFVWKLQVRIPWMEMYEQLVVYKHVHKSTMVPSRYTEDPRLWRWVSKQRTSYTKDKLSEERMGLLNSIDFVWSVKAGT